MTRSYTWEWEESGWVDRKTQPRLWGLSLGFAVAAGWHLFQEAGLPIGLLPPRFAFPHCVPFIPPPFPLSTHLHNFFYKFQSRTSELQKLPDLYILHFTRDLPVYVLWFQYIWRVFWAIILYILHLNRDFPMYVVWLQYIWKGHNNFLVIIPLFCYSGAQPFASSSLRNEVGCLHRRWYYLLSFLNPHPMTFQLFPWGTGVYFLTLQVWAGLMTCFGQWNVAEVTLWDPWSFCSTPLGMLLWAHHVEENPDAPPARHVVGAILDEGWAAGCPKQHEWPWPAQPTLLKPRSTNKSTAFILSN